MKFATTFSALSLLLWAAVPAAHAGPNANSKVLLHLSTVSIPRPCSTTPPACASVVTHGQLYPTVYYASLLVADGSATAGVEGLIFGIDYDGPTETVGVDVFTWSLCATLELAGTTPGWPSAGSDNLITWDETTRCQRNEPGGPGTGVVAVAGYFYVAAYTPSTMRVTDAHRSGTYHDKVGVADCSLVNVDIIDDAAAPHAPSALGSLGFSANGSAPGYNPCAAAVPVRGVTWSQIKAQLQP